MSSPSMIRRAYDLAALIALLNGVALLGVGGYVMATGGISADKMRGIAAVLRGTPPTMAPPTAPPVTQAAAPSTERSKPATTATEASLMDVEIMRREADRLQEELRQRLALNNSILLRVTTEREAFKRERETAKRQSESARKERTTEGFEKQVQIIEGLAPKVALQHLLGMSDVDEAAKLLMGMEIRNAKKIVEAAKKGDQMKQMTLILQRVREAAPDRSTELAANEP